tara:strand:+ start:783 stop:1130 length:348 start_codon:yes stop_codon:yes gene_type:complete
VTLKFFYSLLLFAGVHTLIWFSANAQFISEQWKEKSFAIMLAASVPTAVLVYYATRLGYEALDGSAWGARFLGFGASYFVFPILTYFLLGETMFTLKTMICVLLSFTIIAVQAWM